MPPPTYSRSTLCCALLLLLNPLLVFAQTAPVKVACPKTLVRSAGPAAQLSAEESNYVSARTDTVLPNAWKTYLASVKAALPPATSLPAYVSDILDPQLARPVPRRPDFPKLGIALSGGGLRAAYFAAGVLTSLDARNTTHPSGANGVLQAATYLAGLSGGGWFTTALVQADFPTVPELVFPSGSSEGGFGGFLSKFDLQAGPDGDGAAFIQAVLGELAAKYAAGFPVTLTDAWSRMIARHFVNGTTAENIAQFGPHGDGITFSSLQNVPTIKAHAQPFPIILANAISPAQIHNPTDPAVVADIIPGNSVTVGSEVWEINIFETGSWDPSLGAFIPTRLLGSTPASGRGSAKVAAQCVTGFDQAGYVAGISSNVFNGLNVTTNLLPFTTEGALISIINATFPPQTPVRLDAGAVPNPFKGVNPGRFSASQESFVSLVDGGSNGEVLPLQPLIVKSRGVDTIFAVDAPADLATSYTNGTDLINTAARAKRFPPSLYPFPKVPSSPQTFIDQGLTLRPTFFGCSAADERAGAPLVIYVANGGPSAARRKAGLAGVTDVPTAVTAYSDDMAQAFMDESFAIATQGLGLAANSTAPGAQWSTCLACALVDRARARRGAKREGVCATCFENYCWDGKE